MKKVSKVFGGVLLLALISCGVESTEVIEVNDKPVVESGEQEASIEVPIAIANDSITVSIQGMSCMINCVSSVKKELKKTVGVASITVDFDPEKEIDHATITFDNKQIDSEKIKSIIETVNGGQYKVTEMKSAVEPENVENDSLSIESVSTTNTSSVSIIDQVQRLSKIDVEIPNVFQVLNTFFN